MSILNYWTRPALDYKQTSEEEIVNRVCEHFKITYDQLVSKNRVRARVDARSVVMYLLMQRGYTNKEAGKVVKRDHSTVIHSCKKVEGLMEFDQQFKELVKSFG